MSFRIVSLLLAANVELAQKEICRQHSDILNHLKKTFKVKLQLGSVDATEENQILSASSMIREYPWIMYGGLNIVRQDIFSRLDPFLDRDFF